MAIIVFKALRMELRTLLVVVLFSIPFLIILYRILFLHKENSVTDNYVETRYIKYQDENFSLRVKQSMRESYFHFISMDKKGQNFKAFVFPSFFSWSEIVSINVQRNEDDHRVMFKSKCSFPLQVYAWGKNKRNAERFFANLYRCL